MQADIARHTSRRVNWKDVDKVRSDFGDLDDPKMLFDGDCETGLTQAVSPATMKIYLKKPTYVDGIDIITSDPDAYTGSTVTYHGDDGASYSPAKDALEAESDRVYVAPPNGMPVGVIAITVDPNTVAATYQLAQLVINVGDVVGGVVKTAPADVAQLQLYEVDEGNSTMTTAGTSDFSNEAWASILDRDYTSTIVFTHDGSNDGVMTCKFKTPLLISQIGILGALPINTEVEITKVDDGDTDTFTLGAATTAGWDLGSFDPVLVSEIEITLPGGATLRELIILKTAMNSQSNVADVNIVGSDISVPVEIQEAVEKVSQQYGVDIGTIDLEVSLDVGGWSTIHVYGEIDSGTTDFLTEFSFNNTNWKTYNNAAAVASYDSGAFQHAARYWKLTVTAVLGKTADGIIAAKP